MLFLKFFEDGAAVGDGVQVSIPDMSYLNKRNIVYIKGKKGKSTVKYDSTTNKIYRDFAIEYLTFEATQSGTFRFSGATTAHTLSYSLDGGTTWTTLAHNTDTPTITAGSKIMWKGNLTPSGTSGIGKFNSTGNFNACGNIMSLLYGDNFVGQTDLTGKNWAFSRLFDGNVLLNESAIVNAQNLILPATTLAGGCYNSMFEGCSTLTIAPELPAPHRGAVRGDRFTYYDR